MRRGAKPGKAKVKTRRPVARKSPKVDASGHRELERRLAESLEREKAKDRALTQALDQQTATSDILRVISQSQTDVQPVFDAILASAVRLLRADTGVLTRVAGNQIELAALRSTDAAGDAALRATFPRPLESETPHAQVIRERAPLNIADTQRDPRLSEAVHAAARVRGIRSQVVVPLLRDHEAIGAIGVSRREPGGFTDDEIALLQTFADQAVIAIENVWLFTELEARNRDVTATAEILQVISRSPTDAQPVFDAIAERAVTLCSAAFGAVFRFNDGWLSIAALSGMRPEEAEAAHGHFPRRLTPGGPGLSRVAVTGEPVHIPDVQADSEWRATAAGPAFSAAGFRTCLIVPLNREGLCFGGPDVHRHRDRSRPDLRRPGGHRDRERAVVQGTGGAQL
jgi:GAF domain-containing protein